MSTRGVCDARCQAFFNKMIEKEESMRIKWFLKNQQKLLDRLETTKKVVTPSAREPEHTDKQEHTDTIYLKPLPNWRPMESDGSINMDIMKPIDPQVRALLYEDVPSFTSADNYAYERYKAIPEDRYYYPDCTSWIYGWHRMDYPPVPLSKVGRKAVTKLEFYHPRMSSLQTDPTWYRPCQKTLNKCDVDMI